MNITEARMEEARMGEVRMGEVLEDRHDRRLVAEAFSADRHDRRLADRQDIITAEAVLVVAQPLSV